MAIRYIFGCRQMLRSALAQAERDPFLARQLRHAGLAAAPERTISADELRAGHRRHR
jgi:hypothetical protein